MSIQRATLHQLKIFLCLSEHLSVSKTAKALHLSSPAISIQMKQLAQLIGEPLTEQVGKQIFLTETGNELAIACRDIFDRIERVSQDIAAISNMEKGNLRVAIITTAKYFIPMLLGQFGEIHTGIDFSLFLGNRKEVLDRLHKNKDDLYVLGQPPADLHVNALAFAPNELVAVSYANHPLAKKKNITAKMLSKERFILREEGSGMRLATEKYFSKHKQVMSVRMELNSNEDVKQTVLARLGISFMAISTIQQELIRGELVQLDVEGMPIKREWYLVSPKDKVLSYAAKQFHQYVINEYGYKKLQTPPA